MSCGPGDLGRSSGGVDPGGEVEPLAFDNVLADFGYGTEALEDGGTVDESVAAVVSGGGEIVMVMDVAVSTGVATAPIDARPSCEYDRAGAIGLRGAGECRDAVELLLANGPFLTGGGEGVGFCGGVIGAPGGLSQRSIVAHASADLSSLVICSTDQSPGELHIRDDPLIHTVEFCPGNHNQSIGIDRIPDIPKPPFDRFEALSASRVVDNDTDPRLSIVEWSHTPELLLSGRIPDL